MFMASFFGAIAFMGKFGYAVCVVLPILAVGICSDKRIPRVVRRAHCVLSFGTFAVNVLIAVYWATHPHTLIQW